MANEFDIGMIIKVIFKKILKSDILFILYTDLKFYYDYLVKLSTI